MNRLTGELDGVLHLLDRQVVDVDGLAVCKVDDVELVQTGTGDLVVTGLLTGAAALVPRFGGRLGRTALRQWHRLGIERADRTTPYRIDLDDVERLGSAVELRVGRAGVVAPQRPTEGGLTRRRLNELLQMHVLGDDGRRLGNVTDVRLTRSGRPEDGAPLVVTGLVVGRGHPGSFLGYDRSAEQGPWLVARAVRRLHRHSGLVGMDEVAGIDWEADRIRLSRPDLDALSPAGG